MRYINNLSLGEKIFAAIFFIIMVFYFLFITWKDEINMKFYDNTIIKDQVYETTVLVDYIDDEEKYVVFRYNSKDIYNYSEKTYDLCQGKEGKHVECFLRVMMMGDGETIYTIEEVKNK